MAKVFTYTKSPVSADNLTLEITQSAITIALDYVSVFSDNLDIYFKGDLPEEDKTLLDSIVAAHTGVPSASEEASSISISEQQNDYLPSPRSYKIGMRPIKTDSTGSLTTRGQVLTDEGSFRENFFGTSLFTELSGTFEFSSESDVVLSNNADLSEMKTLYPYIKLSTDSDDKFTQGELLSSKSFGLYSLYKGSSGTGTAISSNWFPTVTDNISMTVANSCLNINSSVSETSAHIVKAMDYLPVRLFFKANMSKRLTGQTASLGLTESCGGDGSKALIVLSGADDTKVTFITSGGYADEQSTVVTIPYGKKTSFDLRYTIEVTNGQCSLLVEDVLLVTHRDKIPDAYDSLSICVSVVNGTISSTNLLKLDWIHIQSLDMVDIANNFSNSPVKTDTVNPKAMDNKPIVVASARPIGTYTYFSSVGDDSSDQSSIAGGNTLAVKHRIGDSTSQAVYFDINSIINETHISKAVAHWRNAEFDTVASTIVPQVTSVSDQVSGDFAVVSGIVVATPAGYGNKYVDLSTAKLVEMVSNEFGVKPAGYWDASYNRTTKAFESVAFNALGYGQFNIFAEEVMLAQFIPGLVFIGNNLLEVPSEDISQLGHNMRVKVLFTTTGDDHNWDASVALRLYRKKTC